METGRGSRERQITHLPTFLPCNATFIGLTQHSFDCLAAPISPSLGRPSHDKPRPLACLQTSATSSYLTDHFFFPSSHPYSLFCSNALDNSIWTCGVSTLSRAPPVVFAVVVRLCNTDTCAFEPVPGPALRSCCQLANSSWKPAFLDCSCSTCLMRTRSGYLHTIRP